MRASELWHAILPQRRWGMRARRVDVLHGPAQQAVQLPVGGDPVQQSTLPVAVAVGDPSCLLVGVDNVGSWHRGARLASM